MTLRLTLACGDYDINQALVRGNVRVQGVDLVALTMSSPALEEQRQILGADPWRYDLPNNRKALEAICRYAFEQALTRDMWRAEDLFFPASLDDPPHYVGA